MPLYAMIAERGRVILNPPVPESFAAKLSSAVQLGRIAVDPTYHG